MMMLKSAISYPMHDICKEKFSCFEKCGWAKAMSESKASYKQEVMIEKPGLSSTHSPSPTPVEETSDDDFAMNMDQWNGEFQRKKAKVSWSEPCQHLSN